MGTAGPRQGGRASNDSDYRHSYGACFEPLLWILSNHPWSREEWHWIREHLALRLDYWRLANAWHFGHSISIGVFLVIMVLNIIFREEWFSKSDKQWECPSFQSKTRVMGSQIRTCCLGKFLTQIGICHYQWLVVSWEGCHGRIPVSVGNDGVEP